MTAVGCPFPVGHCHSERSEESRCLSLVISMPINTSRREDIRLSDDRHQKTVFSNARGTIPPPLAAYKTHRPLKRKRLTTFCASLRSRGPPIGGQENDRVSYLCSAPYTLLPLRGISPQGETRDMERKNRESYISCTIPQFSPFGSERSESITRMRIMPYDS